MNPSINLPLWIDTDNAMGGWIGDVDDAFAIAAILKSPLRVKSISTIFGNTYQKTAFKNTKNLAQLCQYKGPLLEGANRWWSNSSPAATQITLIQEDFRFLALGPLTNLAIALKDKNFNRKYLKEIIFVGTNIHHFLPTMRWSDFNTWKDWKSAREVFASNLPITLVPCDVARKLRFSYSDVTRIPGPLGEFFKATSRRWFWRAKILKLSHTIPIWDLTAAMYVLYPELFSYTTGNVQISAQGQVHIDSSTTASEPARFKILTGFNSQQVAQKYFALLADGII